MRILIVKTSSLGDILHAFPTLHYLRKKFPEAQIDWVVEKPFSELLTAHPYVSHVLCIDTKVWRKNFSLREILTFRKELREHTYDLVFDLQGNMKSLFVTSQARSPNKIGFGKKSVAEWPNLLGTHHRFNPPIGLNVRDENLFLAAFYFQDKEIPGDETPLFTLTTEQQEVLESLPFNKNAILVCPGSAWPNKQLSQEALISYLKTLTSHLLFLWGTPQEKKQAEELQAHFPNSSIVDRLPLPVLQHLMARVDKVIAMDSLPLHLAGTTKTPTFSVFGASSAKKYCPTGPQHSHIQGPCPYGRTFERRCPILRSCKTGACIKNIDLSSQ